MRNATRMGHSRGRPVSGQRVSANEQIIWDDAAAALCVCSSMSHDRVCHPVTLFRRSNSYPCFASVPTRVLSLPGNDESSMCS